MEMNRTKGESEPSAVKGQNPFPGLRPFQADEAHLFFGRERYVETIIDKLNQFHFVSIVGNSGSGKSSLMRAGVIPKLTAQNEWIIVTMRPGKSPVEELSQTIIAIPELKLEGNPSENLRILKQNELGLVQLLRNAIPSNRKLLLVVDQFEELFRFNKEHEEIAIQFVSLILRAIQQREVPIHIIITLRSDFIGDCEQFVGLPEAINNGQFLIPRMKRDELQLSITGPVECVGNRISPRLVQQLVKDVGTNPDQLPILQHVLMRTWDVWFRQHTPETPIDIEHYEQTGKMEKALSNHAEEAMLELNTDEQQDLAALLFKTLTVKESDNRGVRRPTTVSKIAEIANASEEEMIRIINVFRSAERGFLMPPATVSINGKSMIDISHESLMRVWERLSLWVDEEYASAQIYQRITASASLYEKGLSGLWRDPDLQIALDWHQKNHVTKQWSEQYNYHYDLSRKFVEASYQQKQFLIADKRRKRKLSRALLLLAILSLSTLSLWAFFERNKSGKNEQLALAEKQNAQTQEALANEQKKKAEENAVRAEKEKLNAETQQKIAIRNEEEATKQKQFAIQASLIADGERRRAESEKQSAIAQQARADSLRNVDTVSEKNAYRLRILSIAQTLAIKSSAIQKGSKNDDLKMLLALQAYQFNKTYNGRKFDMDVYSALYAADKYGRGKDYKNNSHTDMVRSVVYSPDDKRIASAGSDGILMLSDAVNVEQNTKVFTKQNAILDNCCFQTSGEHIACIADKTTVFVFDCNGSSLLPKIFERIHTDIVTGICWNDNQLVTIGMDNTLRITDSQTQNAILTVPLPGKPTCLVKHPNAPIVFVGFEDGTIAEVPLANKGLVKPFEKVNAKISTIALGSNGTLLAIGTNDGKIKVISMEDKTSFNLNQHTSTVTAVSFDKGGTKLVSSSLDGLIYLWDINQPDVKPVLFSEHDSWVWSVSFNHKGDRFCSAGKDKNVFTYLANEADLVKAIEGTVKRNLTPAEWKQYVGADIPIELTVKTIQ
jgi:WD40 repeat protein